MGIPRKQKPSPAEGEFLFQLDPEPLEECVQRMVASRYFCRLRGHLMTCRSKIPVRFECLDAPVPPKSIFENKNNLFTGLEAECPCRFR